MPPKRKEQITDEQVVQAAAELLKSGVSIESVDLPEEMRARIRSLVTGGSLRELSDKWAEILRPPTREQLIDKLGLRDQWENRADHMAHLIGKDIFKLGKPIPTLEATLNSFTTEQLELANTLQEPTLLLVPETSFAAKVKALDATKTVKGQEDFHVHDFFKQTDFGSENITGWKAMIVEGSAVMAVKEGDDLELTLEDRIHNRKAAQKLGEGGVDRHSYAMLMLEALRKGELMDSFDNGWRWTLLDDDLANSETLAPFADWDPKDRRVYFGRLTPGLSGLLARFRSSVGGDVEL